MNTPRAICTRVILAFACALPLVSSAADDTNPSDTRADRPKEDAATRPHSHMEERLGAGADRKKETKKTRKPRKDQHQHQRDMK